MAQRMTWVTAAACALLVASVALATPIRSNNCPSMCVCPTAKRADCRDIPAWDLKMSPAQVVRIVPPAHHVEPGPLLFSRLDSFPKVQMLSVTNRSIVELVPGTLPFLQVLDVSNNKLSRFSERTFRHMPALRKLTLVGNPIALKEGIPLLTSSSIRTLSLSHCGLHYIPNGSLDGIPLLTSLYLQGNPLKLEDGVPLVDKPSIQELDLSLCKLTRIPRNSLSNLVNLRRLFLRGNELKTISFGEIPLGVHRLDLSANRIRDAPLNVLSAMKNLTTLELASNPLRCTCEFISFLDRLSEHNVIFEKMILCAEPQRYAKAFWKDINESELCKDDIPSEESNDTSEESGGRSTSFSFEKEESSYEADMHPDEENVIVNRHAPPFLLDHLLQKPSRLPNMEENSIQRDQPHSNSSDFKSGYMNDAPATTADSQLHSEEATESPKDDLFVVDSTEAEDESVRDISSSTNPKKTQREEDDSLVVAVANSGSHEHLLEKSNKDAELMEDEKEQEADFENAPNASIAVDDDPKSIPKHEEKSDGSYENPDAETFMKNEETIAMGKMMPNSEQNETSAPTQDETAQAVVGEPILLESSTEGKTLSESGGETAAFDEAGVASQTEKAKAAVEEPVLLASKTEGESLMEPETETTVSNENSAVAQNETTEGTVQEPVLLASKTEEESLPESRTETAAVDENSAIVQSETTQAPLGEHIPLASKTEEESLSESQTETAAVDGNSAIVQSETTQAPLEEHAPSSSIEVESTSKSGNDMAEIEDIHSSAEQVHSASEEIQTPKSDENQSGTLTLLESHEASTTEAPTTLAGETLERHPSSSEERPLPENSETKVESITSRSEEENSEGEGDSSSKTTSAEGLNIEGVTSKLSSQEDVTEGSPHHDPNDQVDVTEESPHHDPNNQVDVTEESPHHDPNNQVDVTEESPHHDPNNQVDLTEKSDVSQASDASTEGSAIETTQPPLPSVEEHETITSEIETSTIGFVAILPESAENALEVGDGHDSEPTTMPPSLEESVTHQTFGEKGLPEDEVEGLITVDKVTEVESESKTNLDISEHTEEHTTEAAPETSSETSDSAIHMVHLLPEERDNKSEEPDSKSEKDSDASKTDLNTNGHAEENTTEAAPETNSETSDSSSAIHMIRLLPEERNNESEESGTNLEARQPPSTEAATTDSAIDTAPVDDKEDHAAESMSGEVSSPPIHDIPQDPSTTTQKASSEEGYKLFGFSLIPRNKNSDSKEQAVSVIQPEQSSSEEFSSESNMPRVSDTDITPVENSEDDAKMATVAYALIGGLLVCIVIAIACVTLRTRSDVKRNGAAPVRIRKDTISPGTEMKDMMNPLLEPIAEAQTTNEFHDDPVRGPLLTVELNGQNGKFPVISPVSKENGVSAGNRRKDGNDIRPADGQNDEEVQSGKKGRNSPFHPRLADEPENITEVVIEAPSGTNAPPSASSPAPQSSQRNGHSAPVNGKPPRQNGTPIISKVKIKESVIPPAVPVYVQKFNGKS